MPSFFYLLFTEYRWECYNFLTIGGIAMKKLLLVIICLFMTACGTKTKDSDISDDVLKKYKEDLLYTKKTKKIDNYYDKITIIIPLSISALSLFLSSVNIKVLSLIDIFTISSSLFVINSFSHKYSKSNTAEL